MASGFLVPESNRSPERVQEVEAAVHAFLDAAHNLRTAADVMPGLRNRIGKSAEGPLELTPEEWTIVRSLQVLYGVDATHSRLDPDAIPSALEQPVFHPEASMKIQQDLRKLLPKETLLKAAVERSGAEACRRSSELIADIVLQVLDGRSSDETPLSREQLVDALEKRFGILRRDLRRHEEPLADLIQAAWGLEDRELEALLGASEGWLSAWRNHEAEMSSEQRARLSALLALHEAIRLHVPPDRYSKWIRRRWKADGLTNGRSALEMLLSEGQDGMQKLGAYLRAEALG